MCVFECDGSVSESDLFVVSEEGLGLDCNKSATKERSGSHVSQCDDGSACVQFYVATVQLWSKSEMAKFSAFLLADGQRSVNTKSYIILHESMPKFIA